MTYSGAQILAMTDAYDSGQLVRHSDGHTVWFMGIDPAGHDDRTVTALIHKGELQVIERRGNIPVIVKPAPVEVEE